MEEQHNSRRFAEQTQVNQSEPTAATQMSQPTQPSAREQSPTIYPSVISPVQPQLPTSQNSTGEAARWSARGEPAVLFPPPVQDSTLVTSQRIAGLLGQIIERQDGIMRELRMMRRDMHLMKSEQRRANVRVVHGIEKLKEAFEQQ